MGKRMLCMLLVLMLCIGLLPVGVLATGEETELPSVEEEPSTEEFYTEETYTEEACTEEAYTEEACTEEAYTEEAYTEEVEESILSLDGEAAVEPTPESVVDSGSCGESVTWTLTTDGVLTISGTGAIKDYWWGTEANGGTEDRPWSGNYGNIQSLVIGDGITAIGAYAFSDVFGIQSVNIPDGVVSIGRYAFNGCTSLASVSIPASVATIGEGGFAACSNLQKISYAGTRTQWAAVSIGYVNRMLSVNPIECSDGNVPVAEQKCGENLSWSLKGNVFTISGSGDMYTYESMEACPWHELRNEIYTVVISNGVTSISSHTFSNCHYLTDVTIAGSVKSMGESVFNACYKLEQIVIPEGMESLGSLAFSSCEKLACVTLPVSLKSIAFYAFNACAALKTVNYSGTKAQMAQVTVDEPNDDLFAASIVCTDGTYEVPTVTPTPAPTSTPDPTPTPTPAPVVYSGSCGENATWTLTKGVLTISGSGAMAEYTNSSDAPWYDHRGEVRSLVVEDGITSICKFADHYILESVVIGKDVEKIRTNAFWGCSKLESVQLGRGLVSIESYAFEGCAALTELTIPAGVTSIGENAFAQCESVTSYTVEAGNTAYKTDASGALYTADMKMLIRYPSGSKAESYTVPSGVKTISSWAFCGAENLKSLTIAGSVTEIGMAAFMCCTALESVVLPDVRELSAQLFSSCTSLKTVSLPETISYISDWVFSDCEALQTINYAGTQEQWQSITISETKNDALATVTFNYGVDLTPEPDTSGSCGDGLTWSFANGVLTITGSGAMTDYEVYQAPWYSLRTKITSVSVGENVTTVGACAFYDCAVLTSVSLPAGLIELKPNAFTGCAALKEIVYAGTERQWWYVEGGYSYTSMVSCTGDEPEATAIALSEETTAAAGRRFSIELTAGTTYYLEATNNAVVSLEMTGDPMAFWSLAGAALVTVDKTGQYTLTPNTACTFRLRNAEDVTFDELALNETLEIKNTVIYSYTAKTAGEYYLIYSSGLYVSVYGIETDDKNPRDVLTLAEGQTVHLRISNERAENGTFRLVSAAGLTQMKLGSAVSVDAGQLCKITLDSGVYSLKSGGVSVDLSVLGGVYIGVDRYSFEEQMLIAASNQETYLITPEEDCRIEIAAVQAGDLPAMTVGTEYTKSGAYSLAVPGDYKIDDGGIRGTNVYSVGKVVKEVSNDYIHVSENETVYVILAPDTNARCKFETVTITELETGSAVTVEPNDSFRYSFTAKETGLYAFRVSGPTEDHIATLRAERADGNNLFLIYYGWGGDGYAATLGRKGVRFIPMKQGERFYFDMKMGNAEGETACIEFNTMEAMLGKLEPDTQFTAQKAYDGVHFTPEKTGLYILSGSASLFADGYTEAKLTDRTFMVMKAGVTYIMVSDAADATMKIQTPDQYGYDIIELNETRTTGVNEEAFYRFVAPADGIYTVAMDNVSRCDLFDNGGESMLSDSDEAVPGKSSGTESTESTGSARVAFSKGEIAYLRVQPNTDAAASITITAAELDGLSPLAVNTLYDQAALTEDEYIFKAETAGVYVLMTSGTLSTQVLVENCANKSPDNYCSMQLFSLKAGHTAYISVQGNAEAGYGGQQQENTLKIVPVDDAGVVDVTEQTDTRFRLADAIYRFTAPADGQYELSLVGDFFSGWVFFYDLGMQQSIMYYNAETTYYNERPVCDMLAGESVYVVTSAFSPDDAPAEPEEVALHVECLSSEDAAEAATLTLGTETTVLVGRDYEFEAPAKGLYRFDVGSGIGVDLYEQDSERVGTVGYGSTVVIRVLEAGTHRVHINASKPIEPAKSGNLCVSRVTAVKTLVPDTEYTTETGGLNSGDVFRFTAETSSAYALTGKMPLDCYGLYSESYEFISPMDMMTALLYLQAGESVYLAVNDVESGLVKATTIDKLKTVSLSLGVDTTLGETDTYYSFTSQTDGKYIFSLPEAGKVEMNPIDVLDTALQRHPLASLELVSEDGGDIERYTTVCTSYTCTLKAGETVYVSWSIMPNGEKPILRVDVVDNSETTKKVLDEIIDSVDVESETAAEEIRSAVQEIGKEELAAAMNGEKGDDVVKKLDALEKSTGSGSVSIVVEESAQDVVAKENVTIVGATLNDLAEDGADVKLTISATEEQELPSVVDVSKAVFLQFDLEGVESPAELAVPVCITMEVPEGIQWELVRLVHHSENSYEILYPSSYVENGVRYARFVIGGFSPFTLTELAHTPGDVDGDGDKDIMDVLALLKSVAGIPSKIVYGDVNNSGAKDIMDVLSLLKSVAGISSKIY